MLHQLGRFDRQRHRHILRRVKLRPIALGDEVGDDLAQLGDGGVGVGRTYGMRTQRLEQEETEGTEKHDERCESATFAFETCVCTRSSVSSCSILSEPRQLELPRRAMLVMVAPAVAVGQMGHDFQHQQVGPRSSRAGRCGCRASRSALRARAREAASCAGRRRRRRPSRLASVVISSARLPAPMTT